MPDRFPRFVIAVVAERPCIQSLADLPGNPLAVEFGPFVGDIELGRHEVPAPRGVVHVGTIVDDNLWLQFAHQLQDAFRIPLLVPLAVLARIGVVEE